MDTEKYEEAVRDYEHVYKTNKTRGKGNMLPGMRNCNVV